MATETRQDGYWERLQTLNIEFWPFSDGDCDDGDSRHDPQLVKIKTENRLTLLGSKDTMKAASLPSALCFNTESCYIAQVGLKILVLLLQFPEAGIIGMNHRDVI